MGLKSVPTAVGADRLQGSALERYPGALFARVQKPFYTPIDDLSLFYHGIEDFTTFTTGERGLAATLTHSGGATIIATENGGVLQLDTSDGTVADNDEAYVGSEIANFLLTANKKLFVDFRIKIHEANTDEGNFIVGLSSTYAANALQDNGAGPPANFSGVVFFKVDGGTVWQLESQKASSAETQTDVGTRVDNTWTRFGIYWNGTDITAYINGEAVGTVITHTADIPTAAMGLLFGAKNGDTNEEKIDCDYAQWFVER